MERFDAAQGRAADRGDAVGGLDGTTGSPYMKIDWHDAKAAANKRKHGVSFEDAAEIFRDPVVVEELDLRDVYGEERVVATGLVDGQVLVVVYTERPTSIRIISARRANKHEQQDYYRQTRT